MRFLIIGSHAMVHHGIPRHPNDFDIIADWDSALEYMRNNNAHSIKPINGGKTLVGIAKGGIIEISIAWPGTTNEELLLAYSRLMQRYPNLDELLALKMSHRYLRNSPHFYKTMKDIRDLRVAGAKVDNTWLKDWLKRREKETYNYKHPDLNQNKAGFFNGDGVTYKYDHDSLHEAVAVNYRTPVYKSYQKDGSEVLCDKNKWDNLILGEKVRAVAEECAVLALERSLIPHPGAMTRQEAFKFALMKVCTSITSGWFREFAWEHHDYILENWGNWDYVAFFEKGLKEGTVKEYVASNS